jgi:ATP-binding protein involved in chromosome partitioning
MLVSPARPQASGGRAVKSYVDLRGDGGSDVPGQVAAQAREVAAALAGVARIVVVASGKGGVGKSTVSAGIARALARSGLRVAALDADLNGPSLPGILGLSAARPRLERDGLLPPSTTDGVAVMSSELFIAEEGAPLRYRGPSGHAFTWRRTAEMTTLRELLAGTTWGVRDWLVVDMPPGAERLPDVLDLLPRLDALVVVTTASPVSLAVVERSLAAARDLRAPVAGLLESMAAHPCGACGAAQALFGDPAATARAATKAGVPCLPPIPFDPALVDGGLPPDGSPSADAFARVAEALHGFVAARHQEVATS